MTWLYIAFIISEWIIRLVMLPVITSRRKPNAAMAWLLLIFFIPGPVWFCFSLSADQLPGARRRKAVPDVCQDGGGGSSFCGHPNIVRPDLGPKLETTVQIAERLGHFPILEGTKRFFWGRPRR